MLDIFNNSAFSTVSMTKAINRVPFKPGRIAELGIFSSEGVNTTAIEIGEENGKLGLIPNRSRLEPSNVQVAQKRKTRTFSAAHLPLEDSVLAGAVQNVREFGGENQLQAVGTVVNKKLSTMRTNHEITLEYHRLGAIKGVVLDADGTTEINNLFTAFGLTQTTIGFGLTTSTTEILLKIAAVRRAVDAAIGGIPYDYIHAFVDANFFDALVTLPATKDAFKYQQSQQLRTDSGAAGAVFEFGKMKFEEMSRSINSTPLIGADLGYAFPVGAPDLFRTYWAPGTMMEAVNTIGIPFYAKQERMKFDKGVEIYTESNPLVLNTRPETSIKLTKA
jgi:hypothetical protein